jgi:hypothetical protein
MSLLTIGMLDVELFTAVFLAFMVGSGNQVFPSIKSKVPLTEEQCWEAVKEDADIVKKLIEDEKGFKVFVVGFCILEERKA